MINALAGCATLDRNARADAERRVSGSSTRVHAHGDEPALRLQYWTGKRIAPEAVASMNEAISQFAAQRSDIASIRAVAGNLDDEFIDRLHDVSPMPQSDNPIDFAARVAAVPQVHFGGAGDSVVPPEVAQRFVRAAGGRCAQARTVGKIAHDGDWSRFWPDLLRVTPVCVDQRARPLRSLPLDAPIAQNGRDDNPLSPESSAAYSASILRANGRK